MVSDGAIYPELLESFVRNHLDRTAHRYVCCVCIAARNDLVENFFEKLFSIVSIHQSY